MKNRALAEDGNATPKMFARYGHLIQTGLSSKIPYKQENEIYDMHAYHIGLADAEQKRIDPELNMGKCLRPTLCLFICDALRGNISDCVNTAISIELIHNFSLIHDDIQDQDIERRHRETVWRIWGIPKAIISGNALHTLGDIVSSLDVHEQNNIDTQIHLSRLLTESYMKMIIGQCDDVSFETQGQVSVEKYLDMIAGKTGALIQGSIMMGAMFATNNLGIAEQFDRIGFLLGQAFQIRDDYLGMWGDPQIIGKPIGGDLYRKKKTYPVIHGFANASTSEQLLLSELYSKPELNEYDVASIMEILQSTDSQNATLEFIQDISGRAKESLENLELPEWAIEEMSHLIDFLTSRTK